MTTNTIASPGENSTVQSSRPVVETVEHYENKLMNILAATASRAKPTQQATTYLDKLESSLPELNDKKFLNFIHGRSYVDSTNTSKTITDISTELTSLRTIKDYQDLSTNPVTLLIINAYAKYEQYKAQVAANSFDAIHRPQTQSESFTPREIESAAERAKLVGHSIYYRNGKALRITSNNTTGKLEAQILNRTTGAPGATDEIKEDDIPALLAAIEAQSQEIKDPNANNVQKDVEERDELDFQQIASAIEFINKGKNDTEKQARTGFYSFMKTRFAIRGTSTADVFSIDVPQADGTIKTETKNKDDVANYIKTNAEKPNDARQKGVEIKQDLDLNQVFAALDFVDKKRNKNIGYYSFDGQLFSVKEDPAGTTGYIIEVQDENGDATPEHFSDSAEAIKGIREKAKKKNAIVDMGNDFDPDKFAKLLERAHDKHTSATAGTPEKTKTFYYMLGGKRYAVTYNDENHYQAEYPRNGKTLHEHKATAKELADLLMDHDKGIHLYDEHHDTDRGVLMESIRELTTKKSAHYIHKGHKYEMRKKFSWLKGLSTLGIANGLKSGSKYYADVPAGEHGKVEIGPFLSQEALYKAIREKISHTEHSKEGHGTAEKESHEKKNEHAEGEHAHPTESIGFFKRIGGWVDGSAKWTWKKIPKFIKVPLAGTAKVVRDSALTGAAVFGVSGGLGLLGYGTASVFTGGLIIPGMLGAASISTVYRLLKTTGWIKEKKSEESHGSHAGGDAHAHKPAGH